MNNCAVRGNHRAYPVAEAVPKFPDVFFPVGKGVGALAVEHIVSELQELLSEYYAHSDCYTSNSDFNLQEQESCISNQVSQ